MVSSDTEMKDLYIEEGGTPMNIGESIVITTGANYSSQTSRSLIFALSKGSASQLYIDVYEDDIKIERVMIQRVSEVTSNRFKYTYTPTTIGPHQIYFDFGGQQQPESKTNPINIYVKQTLAQSVYSLGQLMENNLNTMGVSVESGSGLTTMANKILEIETNSGQSFTLPTPKAYALTSNGINTVESTAYIEDTSAPEQFFGVQDSGSTIIDPYSLWTITSGSEEKLTFNCVGNEDNVSPSITIQGVSKTILTEEFTSEQNYILTFDYVADWYDTWSAYDRNFLQIGASEGTNSYKYQFGQDTQNTVLEDSNNNVLTSFDSILIQKNTVHNYKIIRDNNIATIILDNQYIITNLNMTNTKNTIGLWKWGNDTYENTITVNNLHLYVPKPIVPKEEEEVV